MKSKEKTKNTNEKTKTNITKKLRRKLMKNVFEINVKTNDKIKRKN